MGEKSRNRKQHNLNLEKERNVKRSNNMEDETSPVVFTMCYLSHDAACKYG